MHIRVISFGMNWWSMYSTDTSDPYCFRRRVAYFNAAALMFGRRLRHSALYPGQIRFNATSGFDPEFQSRSIGRTFLCSGPSEFGRKTHLLFMRLTSKIEPDAYLVTLRSADHGAILFDEPGWRSRGVQPISISQRRKRYEAMLLMRHQDWVKTDLGRWRIDAADARLVLAEEVQP